MSMTRNDVVQLLPQANMIPQTAALGRIVSDLDNRERNLREIVEGLPAAKGGGVGKKAIDELAARVEALETTVADLTKALAGG